MPNTYQGLRTNVGHTGLWRVSDQIRVKVQIVDARQVYDRVDFLITPLNGGDGEQWVSASKVFVLPVAKVVASENLSLRPAVLGGSHDAITWRGGK